MGWTVFVWGRVPVILIVFLLARRHFRRRGVPCTPWPFLLTALLGLLLTTGGDLATAKSNWPLACLFFGLSHLCWFAYLLGRGRFSWGAAGVLTLLIAPLLAAVVMPKIGAGLKLPFAGYALCTILSVSAAVGARRSPGGRFWLAGLLALMVSDICIGLSMAKVRGAGPMILPLYYLSLGLLLAALVRGIPAPRPKRKVARRV